MKKFFPIIFIVLLLLILSEILLLTFISLKNDNNRKITKEEIINKNILRDINLYKKGDINILTKKIIFTGTIDTCKEGEFVFKTNNEEEKLKLLLSFKLPSGEKIGWYFDKNEINKIEIIDKSGGKHEYGKIKFNPEEKVKVEYEGDLYNFNLKYLKIFLLN